MFRACCCAALLLLAPSQTKIKDLDGDGISDAKDVCPAEAETVNGFKDDDGCPDDKVLALQLDPAPAKIEKTENGDQQRWVVAVMDVDTSSAESINKKTQRALSDQIRIFLAQRRLRVVDRGAQEAAMRELVQGEKAKSYRECVDTSCQIPLGKALAATHVLRATIAAFDAKTCTTNAELIDLKAEVTVAAVSVPSGCKPAELLKSSEKLADELVRASVR